MKNPFKDLEENIFGVLGMTLWIVVLIVLVTNAGGVATLIGTFFRNWNSLLGTLLDRSPQQAF